MIEINLNGWNFKENLKKICSIIFNQFFSGPCQANEIFILRNSSTIAVCIENTCGPGKVIFKGSCALLNEEDACNHFYNLVGRKLYLVPDPTTFKLTCADVEFKFTCDESCCYEKRRRNRKICHRKSENAREN